MGARQLPVDLCEVHDCRVPPELTDKTLVGRNASGRELLRVRLDEPVGAQVARPRRPQGRDAESPRASNRGRPDDPSLTAGLAALRELAPECVLTHVSAQEAAAKLGIWIVGSRMRAIAIAAMVLLALMCVTTWLRPDSA